MHIKRDNNDFTKTETGTSANTRFYQAETGPETDCDWHYSVNPAITILTISK